MSQACPCQPGPVTIPGRVGPLEALIGCPEVEPEKPIQAVICHPHPLYGGSMQNKVVHTLARGLAEQGACTLRFNFRGVGGSAGRYDHGTGESDDLVGIADWAQSRCPAAETWFAGFSFGAYVALRATARWPVARLILVAPPVNLYDFSALPAPGPAAVVLHGDEDEVVPVAGVRDWIRSLDVPPTLIIIRGAGHFFHQRLGDLRASLQSALAPRVPPDTGS